MSSGRFHRPPETKFPAHKRVAVRGRGIPHTHWTSATVPMGTSDQVRELFTVMEDEGTMVVSSLQPSATLTRREREGERKREGERDEGRERSCIGHHHSRVTDRTGTEFR